MAGAHGDTMNEDRAAVDPAEENCDVQVKPNPQHSNYGAHRSRPFMPNKIVNCLPRSHVLISDLTILAGKAKATVKKTFLKSKPKKDDTVTEGNEKLVDKQKNLFKQALCKYGKKSKPPAQILLTQEVNGILAPLNEEDRETVILEKFDFKKEKTC